MEDSITICGHKVTVNKFDFGGMVGLSQPHFQVLVETAENQKVGYTFKVSPILPLGNSIPSVTSDHLTIQKQIGGGNFGKVFKGESETGKLVAIKVPKIRKGKIPEDIALTLMEGVILSVISHKNLIRMVSLATNNTDLPWIVLEYAENGSLYRTLEAVSKAKMDEEEFPEYWTEETKLKISYGIICGLQYLHCHQCVHRDLTARNVLLMENFEPKLCDFGLTAFLQGGGVIIQGEGDARRTAYSLQYCAPEVFPWFRIVTEADLGPPIDFNWLNYGVPLFDDSEFEPPELPEEYVMDPVGIYDYKSDVWAYGVVLYQIWSDGTHIPFSATNKYPTVEDMKDALLVLRKSPWDFKPLDTKKYPTICAILPKTFKYNPKNRISVPVIKEKLGQEMKKFTL